MALISFKLIILSAKDFHNDSVYISFLLKNLVINNIILSSSLSSDDSNFSSQ